MPLDTLRWLVTMVVLHASAVMFHAHVEQPQDGVPLTPAAMPQN
jgi:hypothetical protein